ncbi:T9SS type A sorting domain-containing protein, partial [Marine Group I thaumarchaeote]|nr:T9SS type A sorting domain-containing protein [Marine Group I thaumarchaeote]
EIELKDNSHITQDSHFHNGLNQYLAYSLFNQPFDSRTTEILLMGAGLIDLDDIQITISDINGDALYLSHSKSGEKYQTGPYKFEMEELYPNPFNPSTQISFSLAMDDYVKLSAYNIRGNEVDVIFEGAQGVGQHSYTWNASNLPSGVYYIRLQAGSLVSSQKALLIK